MKNENSVIFYQCGSNAKLKINTEYRFEITRAAYIEARGILQLVFELTEFNGDGSKFSLLENFAIGSDRCDRLFEQFYPLDTCCKLVSAIEPDSFCRCSGYCTLFKGDSDNLHVNLDEINVTYYTSSPLHDYLINAETPARYRINGQNTVTFKENCFSQPYQPDELEANTIYYFTVKKAHSTPAGVLQVIYEIHILDSDDRAFYLLEEYVPGTARFDEFVANAYRVSASFGYVIEMCPQDLSYSFSGACCLEEHDGRLRIKFDSIEPAESVVSRLDYEQIVLSKGDDDL